MSFKDYISRLVEPAHRGIVTSSELANAFFDRLGDFKPARDEIGSAFEQIPDTALPDFQRTIEKYADHDHVLVNFRIGDSRSFDEKMAEANANREFYISACGVLANLLSSRMKDGI